MTIPTLADQLASPTPDGSAIALYRTRVYRFSDDPRHYVIAEAAEEKYASGHMPARETMAYITASLHQIRSGGSLLPYDPRIAAAEGIHMQQELDARTPYAPSPRPQGDTAATVFIVGAPRSGTSHLFNCLAYTGRYAYFTTASCWAWPVRNLRHPSRTSFETLDTSVLTVDNKKTRLVPGLVMPYESEDLYGRAIPAYRHLGGHTYDLAQASIHDAALLSSSIHAHRQQFSRSDFLTKSPFNSLRIPQIEEITGRRALYLNIQRDRSATADSMRRNHFRFRSNGANLTEEDAWSLFAQAIDDTAPPSRTIRIDHAELLSDTKTVLARITNWITATTATT
ncbi:sulfotransferase [Streptomyces sp. NPDC048269]|uniref:sulfotransferase n=1 Tax=Streptomyces sp. NPDC048269 TaxID=3155753 RepID=UPI00343C70B1